MFFQLPELVLFADEDRDNNNTTRNYKGTRQAIVGGCHVKAWEPRPESNKPAWARISNASGLYKTFVVEGGDSALAFLQAASQALHSS